MSLLGPVVAWLRVVLGAAGDLVLAGGCAGCGGGGPEPLCQVCAARFAGPARLVWPVPAPAGLPPPWAVAGYRGPVRRALLAYKEDGRSALLRVLGPALGRSVVAARGTAPGRGLVLVPVPSRPGAVRVRGRDHVGELARAAARGLAAVGVDAEVVPALRHVRATADQSGLDAAARAANLRGALGLRRQQSGGLSGRAVVVVDDLVTTGATLAEAARALRAGGVEPVAVAAVAATLRTGLRGPPPGD